MDDLSTKVGKLSTERRRLLALLLEQQTSGESRQKGIGAGRLVAFIVPKREPAPEAGELRSFLESRLPDYMIPAAFVALTSFPLTPNGKVDRRALISSRVAGAPPERSLVSPRDPLELELVRIWEEVLGSRPVGVRDNFFELGGHSLVATRLMFRIQQAFGIELPLSVLFQATTVEDLAVVVRQQREPTGWSSLVPIRSGGSRRPFFCVHGGGGNVLCYFDLARRLTPDHPFYAFEAVGLRGSEQPATSVEEMACRYVASMRVVQPSGPYLLGGWSVGGVIAFEMARQLEAAGQLVELLALIDASAPGIKQFNEGDEDGDVSFVFAFGYNLGLPVERLAVSRERLRRLDLDEQLGHLLTLAGEGDLFPPDMTLSQVRRFFDVFKANVSAARQYKPRATTTAVKLFKATQRRKGFSHDRHLGWRAFVRGQLETFETPGDHFTMLREPNVRGLAGLLSDCLRGGDG